jgi:hypothetical protein
MAKLIRCAKAIGNKWWALCLQFCESKRLGTPSKQLRVGEDVDLERFVKANAASKQGIIRRQADKIFGHGTSLKENEHEQS